MNHKAVSPAQGNEGRGAAVRGWADPESAILSRMGGTEADGAYMAVRAVARVHTCTVIP